MRRPYRLAYLVSHPIQYQAPLLRLIAQDPDIELKAFFCSDFSMRKHMDAGFGQEIEWDVPLVEGYDHEFLPARADDGPPSVFRPVNRGMPKALRDGGFDALWVHGYMRWYHLTSMARARLQGQIVLNRDEAWAMSTARGPARDIFKKFFYFLLRRICHGFLVIGSANRDYYMANGMQPDSLFIVPYAVDNAVFQKRADAAAARRDDLRRELTLEPGRPVILYASKFIRRKCPDDLVEAFIRIAGNAELRNPYLVLVGDGEMRGALERQVVEAGLSESVRFTGFQNQSDLPRFYDLCDVFVLPSLLEPWGLVVNELMCAGRAVIASDQVGAAYDLIRNGENGYVYPAGNVSALQEALGNILADPERCREMGAESRKIVANWSFAEDIAGIKQALRHFVGDSPDARNHTT